MRQFVRVNQNYKKNEHDTEFKPPRHPWCLSRPKKQKTGHPSQSSSRHPPNTLANAHLSIVDGEQDEAVGILLEERLLGVAALELGALVLGHDDGLDGVLGGRVVHVGVVGVGRAAGGRW